MGAYLNLNLPGKAGLTATLFLIGTSLSKSTLQTVGEIPHPLLAKRLHNDRC
jgi:hypothetical protein